VARRALEALIYTQVIAQQDDEDFTVAYIGEEFNFPHRHRFVADYLRHLFGYSSQLAMNGDPWRKTLPGDASSAAEQVHAPASVPGQGSALQ
jgi:hypothetical protein